MQKTPPKGSRTIILFYIVVSYVFASYLWWSFLLSQKNTEAFQYHTEMERIKYNVENQEAMGSDAFLGTAAYQALVDRYDRQKWMIRGEGAVFLLLLGAGAFSVRRYLSKEIQLARQKNNFLLSITHELKSPLASIKLSLQTFTRRVEMEPKFQKLVDNSLLDVDRLTSLVDNILFAAKMEDRSYVYHMEEGDLSTMVSQIAGRYKEQNQQHYHWHLNIEPGLDIMMEQTPMTSVVMNLIENAIKYSPKGTHITVNLSKQAKQAKLEVMDEGMGIPLHEASKVFDKFYRIGNEETRSAKGTGLGLFLVKRVVEEHGGTVQLTANKPHGAIFTILLPLV